MLSGLFATNAKPITPGIITTISMIVTCLGTIIFCTQWWITYTTPNQNRKYVSRSHRNSIANICNDSDVCHPSQAYGNGNPIMVLSGASMGSTYHDLVNTVKDMMVTGITNFQMSCFITLLDTSFQNLFSGSINRWLLLVL